MKKSSSKSDAKKQIEEFFGNLKDKNSKQIKKTKRLAMSHNISLKEKRKLFCKKCFTQYKTPKIRIKKGIKSVACEKCGFKSRCEIK